MLVPWALTLSFILYWSVAGYQIIRDYSGDTFFNGWEFYGFIDNLSWGVYDSLLSASPARSRWFEMKGTLHGSIKRMPPV